MCLKIFDIWPFGNEKANFWVLKPQYCHIRARLPKIIKMPLDYYFWLWDKEIAIFWSLKFENAPTWVWFYRQSKCIFSFTKVDLQPAPFCYHLNGKLWEFVKNWKMAMSWPESHYDLLQASSFLFYSIIMVPLDFYFWLWYGEIAIFGILNFFVFILWLRAVTVSGPLLDQDFLTFSGWYTFLF